MIEQSTLLACIECWLARQLPDDILADALEESDRLELANRLRRLSKHKGKLLKRCTSSVTRDIIGLMPRMRVRRWVAERKRARPVEAEGQGLDEPAYAVGYFDEAGARIG